MLRRPQPHFETCFLFFCLFKILKLGSISKMETFAYSSGEKGKLIKKFTVNFKEGQNYAGKIINKS